MIQFNPFSTRLANSVSPLLKQRLIRYEGREVWAAL